MTSIDDLDFTAADASLAEWRQRQRQPHVRAWRFLRYGVPALLAALACRVRGHRWEEHTYWTDCSREWWARCRRCGEEVAS